MHSRINPFSALLASIALVAASLFAVTLTPQAAQASNPSCVDGTHYSTSSSGAYTLVTFTSTTACDFTLPGSVTSIDYLAVGGGGAGGGGGLRVSLCSATPSNEKPGGGGAGGAGGVVRHAEGVSVTSGDTLTVQVGAGGTAGKAGGCVSSGSYTNTGIGETGGTGGNSSVYNGATELATATGGYGGAGGNATGHGGTGGNNADYSGGSNLGANDCPASATTGCFAAGGGAGAAANSSSIASNAVTTVAGGNGGAGYTWSVNSTTYGGGGGGGNRHPFTQPSAGSRYGGSGGSGGGGHGGSGSDYIYGVAGTNGLGGGGGGGRGNGSSAPNGQNSGSGGAGGKGAVILRYLTPTSSSVYVVADNKTVNFGDSAPSYTYTMHEGSASGTLISDPAGLTGLTCTSAYSTTTPVASSPVAITCSGATADGYTFEYVAGLVTINSGVNTISFANLPNRRLEPNLIKLNVSAASGLTVTVESLTPLRCVMVGVKVKTVRVGTCTLRATQEGDSNWASAAPVTKSFSIVPIPNTIGWPRDGRAPVALTSPVRNLKALP